MSNRPGFAPRLPSSPLPLIGLLMALGLPVACGDPSAEARLAEAEQQLKTARAEQDRSQARFDERLEALEAAQAAVDEAREALNAADERVRQAESEVAVHATDDVLFRKVQKRLLEDPKLSDVAIAAEVRDGVVTLRGEAAPEVRDHALEMTSAIPGVRQVLDEIRVPQPRVEEQAS